jgi:hypothetical protein
MNPKKSEMLSAMGTVWEIVKNIWNAVLELGGTDEDMKKVLKPGGSNMVNDLALVILGKAKVVMTNEVVSADFDLDYWVLFYKKYFNFTAVSSSDFSDLKIPQKPTEGRWRLLVILQGLTNNQVYDACKEKFHCSRYTEDLDSSVPTNERDPKNGTYAIWVRDTVEADEVHQNKSAGTLKSSNLKMETLLERILHELQYFMETGKHLDMSSWTLCCGSRDSEGDVPDAGWRDSEFLVGWSNTYNYGRDLRSREVVS